MSITMLDISTYIFANRMTLEDKRYLLNDNTTKGADLVKSASLWIFARFIKADKADYFLTFMTKLKSFSSSDLASMATIETKFVALDPDQGEMYTMLFDTLVNYSIYNFFASVEAEDRGLDKKKEAQEQLEGILGAIAFPDSNEPESFSNEMHAVVDIPTQDYMTSESYGLRPGYRRGISSYYEDSE